MAEGQGLVLTKNILKDQLNTDYFRDLYSSVDLARQQQESALLYDYSKDIGQAYAASLQRSQDIMSSNVGQGYKDQLLEDSNLALEQAYNQYLQNYTSNLNEVNENYNKTLNTINTARDYQVENVQRYTSGLYQYLSYLYSNDMRDSIFNRDEYQQFIEDDNLINEYNFNKLIFDTSDITSPISEMTEKGKDIYRLLMFDRALPQSVPSYETWLGTNEKTKDLYDWLYARNPYSSTPERNRDTLYNLLDLGKQEYYSREKNPETTSTTQSNKIENIDTPSGWFGQVKKFATNAVGGPDSSVTINGTNYPVHTLSGTASRNKEAEEISKKHPDAESGDYFVEDNKIYVFFKGTWFVTNRSYNPF